ncbi:MAG: BamA/TamA family outer membrane protein [Acidobacteriota bacterium]
MRSFGYHLTSEFNQKHDKEPGFAAYVDVNYFYFPQVRFFGFGPDSRRVDRTDFLLRTASYEAVGGYQINDWLGVSARAGLLQFDVDPGKDDRYTNTEILFPNLPGLDHQPDFYRISSAVLADNRDRPADPHNGGAAGFLFSHYRDKDGRQFEFNRYALDLRQYLPVDPLLSVIAVRFFSSVDDPVGQSRIPFYLTEWLGGGSTLRGFSRQRFRDRNLLLFNGEFRTHVTDELELVVFYDTGKVFSDLDDYSFKRLEKGYGGGFRLKGGTILFLRFDVGHSQEGTQLHVDIGPAF